MSANVLKDLKGRVVRPGSKVFVLCKTWGFHGINSADLLSATFVGWTRYGFAFSVSSKNVFHIRKPQCVLSKVNVDKDVLDILVKYQINIKDFIKDFVDNNKVYLIYERDSYKYSRFVLSPEQWWKIKNYLADHRLTGNVFIDGGK